MNAAFSPGLLIAVQFFVDSGTGGLLEEGVHQQAIEQRILFGVSHKEATASVAVEPCPSRTKQNPRDIALGLFVIPNADRLCGDSLLLLEPADQTKRT